MTSREKYRVLRKLDSGGMAEVFVGESESIEGFKKLVAIKRVLPDLAKNSKFLSMFLDEARLSLGFNHANVVQTFDIGRSDRTYFIVMEYVDGTNLKKLMEYLKKNRIMIPVEMAVYIVTEICRGLSYAHNLCDPSTGKSLEIVHRDVSPPNILLSKQGEVKIVDFGLAKATGQLEKTDPGVVKGKFAYLSPEAAHGHKVDHRADIFACGIILCELLTGRRLFLGKTDLETVDLIRNANIPSINSINPMVPLNLEVIARKALTQEPTDRFSGCDNFAEALAGFLFEYGRKVSSFDLQRIVAHVQGSNKETTREFSIIEELIQEEMARFSSLDENSPVGRRSEQRPSFGAIPLDPTGFVKDPSRSPSDVPSMIPQDTLGNGSLVDDRSRSAPPSDPPALAQMLEGEIKPGLRPPISLSPPPTASAQTRIFLIAVVAAAFAATCTVLAAYAIGWIP
jgi:serine/threonine protein kinase